MRRLLTSAGLLAVAGLILSSLAPALEAASHAVTLDLRGCLLVCRAKQATLPDLRSTLEPDRRPVVVTIDAYPDAWQRARDVEVRGAVRTVDGAPVPSVRVDLYLNRTKAEPGSLVGTVTTDRSGQWRYRGDAPTLPPGDYQLVARSRETRRVAFLYLEGWSDPGVSLWSATDIILARRWENVGWTVEARLVDDAGAPLPARTLASTVDGQHAADARTDADGVARLTLPGPGPRVVQVSYAGEEGYLPARAELSLPPPSLRLDSALLLVRPGEAPLVSGTTEPGLTVTAGGAQATADADGRFAISLTPPAVPGAASYEVAAGPTRAPLVVRAGAPLALQLDVADIGVFGVDVDVRATSDGVPVAGVPVTVAAGPRSIQLATDAEGRASARVDLERGRWPVTASIDRPDLHPATASDAIRVVGLADVLLVVACCASAVGGVRLAPHARRLLRRPARVLVRAPRRAVAGEPLEVLVEAFPTGVVELRVVEVPRAPGASPRALRLATVAAPSGRFHLVAPHDATLLLEARRLPSREARGAHARATVPVLSYADALAAAGRADLAELARWGPPEARREIWVGGGAPA